MVLTIAEINALIPEVALEVMEITGMPLDYKRVRVYEGEKAPETTSDAAYEAILDEFERKWSLSEQRFYLREEGAFVADAIGRLLPNTTEMTYHGVTQTGEHVVSIGALCREDEEGVRKALAHELTHVQDDQQYGMHAMHVACYREQLQLYDALIEVRRRPFHPMKEMGIAATRTLIRQSKRDHERLRNITESHAVWVERRYARKHGIKPKKIQRRRRERAAMALYLAHQLVRELTTGDRMKERAYQDGLALVETMYKTGVPIGFAYQNIPTWDEYRCPLSFVHRHRKAA